jgi:hypothetical protein
MNDSKRQKRSSGAAVSASALSERAILQQIFSYVGMKEWLYVAGVCSDWRALYLQLLASQPRAKLPHHKRRFCDEVTQTQTTHAAALASVTRLELALQCGISYCDLLAEQAGAMCTRERLQQLIENGLGLRAALCTGAARAGRVRTLMWLKQQRCPFDLCKVLTAALQHAHLQVLDWVRDDEQLWSEVLIHLPFEPGSSVIGASLLEAAASSASTLVLSYMQVNGLLDEDGGRYIAQYAARLGHLPLLKWLHQQGYEIDSDETGQAAEGGHLAALQYLHETVQCSLDDDGLYEAKDKGHVDIMRYYKAAGVGAWSAVALAEKLEFAGFNGHLAAAQWLRSLGAEWPAKLWEYDHYTTNAQGRRATPATCWNLNTLQWAISSGCPWGEPWPYGVCTKLVACHYDEEVEWAHANGCPCPADCLAR